MVALVAAAQPNASAQSQHGPIDATHGTSAEGADEQFAAGSRAFERGDATTALMHMRRAFALQPDYRNAGGLGQIELHLGRYRDAAEHLEQSLREYPAAGDPEAKGLVMQGFAEARARVVTLTLEGQQPGVELLVDGEVVATLPVEHDLFIEPGEHTFHFRKTGFEGNEAHLYVPAGSNHTLRPQMRPVAEGAPAPSTAVRTKETEVGTLILVTGGVLTVAAVGVGVGFHFGAEAARDDAARQRAALRETDTACVSGRTAPGCGNLHNTLQLATDRDRVASLAFLGSAGAALLTLGVYGLIGASAAPSDGQDAASVMVSPMVGEGEAALSVWGRF